LGLENNFLRQHCGAGAKDFGAVTTQHDPGLEGLQTKISFGRSMFQGNAFRSAGDWLSEPIIDRMIS